MHKTYYAQVLCRSLWIYVANVHVICAHSLPIVAYLFIRVIVTGTNELYDCIKHRTEKVRPDRLGKEEWDWIFQNIHSAWIFDWKKCTSQKTMAIIWTVASTLQIVCNKKKVDRNIKRNEQWRADLKIVVKNITLKILNNSINFEVDKQKKVIKNIWRGLHGVKSSS